MQKMERLVSVIVPSYNYGRFIGQALESLRAQTYSRWECIVVDDGSTDNTDAIVTSFAENDSRIEYIRQENQGLAAARNAGIAHSAGEYLQFLDADDLLESEKLERQVEFLEQHDDIDIVFSDSRYFRTENMQERRFSQDEANAPWVVKLSASGTDVLRPLVRNNIMVVSSPLLRRSVIADVGLFDGTVKGVEDWHYWIRCAIEGKHFHYLDAEGTWALVRVHGSSMSRDARLMLRSILLMHQKVAGMVCDTAILQLNKQVMAEREGLLGIEEVSAGELLAGIRHLCRALMMDRNARHKAKWLFCAASAPIVSHQWLRKMVTTSFSRSLSGFLSRSE